MRKADIIKKKCMNTAYKGTVRSKKVKTSKSMQYRAYGELGIKGQSRKDIYQSIVKPVASSKSACTVGPTA
jgi:hypothetical protein